MRGYHIPVMGLISLELRDFRIIPFGVCFSVPKRYEATVLTISNVVSNHNDSIGVTWVLASLENGIPVRVLSSVISAETNTARIRMLVNIVFFFVDASTSYGCVSLSENGFFRPTVPSQISWFIRGFGK